MRKKLFAILLSISMLFTAVPAYAAAETDISAADTQAQADPDIHTLDEGTLRSFLYDALPENSELPDPYVESWYLGYTETDTGYTVYGYFMYPLAEAPADDLVYDWDYCMDGMDYYGLDYISLDIDCRDDEPTAADTVKTHETRDFSCYGRGKFYYAPEKKTYIVVKFRYPEEPYSRPDSILNQDEIEAQFVHLPGIDDCLLEKPDYEDETEAAISFSLDVDPNYTLDSVSVSSDYDLDLDEDGDGIYSFTIPSLITEPLTFSIHTTPTYQISNGILTFDDNRISSKYLLSIENGENVSSTNIIYGTGGNSTDVYDPDTRTSSHYLDPEHPSLFIFTYKDGVTDGICLSLVPETAGTVELIAAEVFKVSLSGKSPATLYVSHNYGSWKTTKPATATTTGVKERECLICHEKETASIAKLTPASIAKATVSGIKTKTYTGKKLTQAVTVKLAGKTLKNDTDYTVSYSNNQNLGTATMTITGKGAYTGRLKKTFRITTSKGKTYTVANMNYKITNAATDGTGTVTLTGSTTGKSKLTALSVASTVKIGGKSFRITEIGSKAFKNYTKLKTATLGTNVKKIGSSAFSGCKTLKTITIRSKKLTSVGKSAISGIYKKATVKVPSAKLKDYKKLFKSSTGWKSTMKCKK